MKFPAIIASAFCIGGLPLVSTACTCALDDSPVNEQIETAVLESDVVAEVQITSTSIVTVTKEVSGKKWSWTDKQYHKYVEIVNEPQLLAQMTVLRYWKGKHHGSVAVGTATQWQACGLGLKPGQHLLLYARSTADGILETDSCTRTKSVGEAKAEMKTLDSLRKDLSGRRHK